MGPWFAVHLGWTGNLSFRPARGVVRSGYLTRTALLRFSPRAGSCRSARSRHLAPMAFRPARGSMSGLRKPRPPFRLTHGAMSPDRGPRAASHRLPPRLRGHVPPSVRRLIRRAASPDGSRLGASGTGLPPPRPMGASVFLCPFGSRAFPASPPARNAPLAPLRPGRSPCRSKGERLLKRLH